MGEINWQKWASVAITVAAGVAATLLGLRVVLGCLLPFLLAWALSLGITPLSCRVALWFRLPQKLCAAVLFTAVLCGGVLLLGSAVHRLLSELEELLSRLAEVGVPSINGEVDYFEVLSQRIPVLERLEANQRESVLRENVNRAISRWIDDLLASLQERVPEVAARLLSAIPSVLLFLAVTVIAGFYFCMDRQGIEAALSACLPKSVQRRLPALRGRVKRLSGRYLRAYLLLLLLTLAAVFLGLTVLRVEYAFLLATVIAVVDLLPVLGVGTVLLPWSALELIRRDYRLGVGLLVLYLAVTLLHQVLEPRLVGKSLGLHPLLTLAAGYAGFRLFGVVGMVLGPFFALGIRGLGTFLRQETDA